ncbi:hypothetical protein I4U23_018551 [Adineta vaga]|nr:hypothetical protein I4U23_018551 [Adineta vaga]
MTRDRNGRHERRRSHSTHSSSSSRSPTPPTPKRRHVASDDTDELLHKHSRFFAHLPEGPSSGIKRDKKDSAYTTFPSNPSHSRSTFNVDRHEFEARREERIRIAEVGTNGIWSRSPVRIDEDLEEKIEKKKKSSHKKKDKKKKSKKKRRKHSSSSASSSSAGESDAEPKWIETKTKKSSTSATSCSQKPDHDDDNLIGPQLPEHLRQGDSSGKASGGDKPLDFGKALLPGEGEAMAKYVAEGKRIPRRGEIGLQSDEITQFEELGYVMSGSRHRRMEAVRLRKENQVYSADEKRALATFNNEIRSNREKALMTQFQIQGILHINAKWVRDVDSKIIDEIKQNPSIAYLIQFHAPWCGHCRKFEPVYEEIAKEIYDLSSSVDEFKNIRIVRIDATVYTDVASRYDVRGYPTIKFIRGSQIFPYDNERSKPAVLEFLRRVNGPALRWIPSIAKFNEIRREHDVFFLFVTTTYDENEELFKQYKDLVNRYLSQTYFYATNVSIIQQTYFAKYKTDGTSQIFAIKTEGFYLYKPEEYSDSLDEFIAKEKVATFPQVASGNIHDLIVTKRIVIIYAFKDQHEIVAQKQKRNELKTQMRSYIMKHLATLRDTFQFSWSNDLDLLSNIAVWTLDEPLIFLYDSVVHKYGIYPLSAMMDSNIQLEPILDYIINNHTDIIQHSGDTWSKRLFRPFWEIYRTVISMFIEAPFISLLIIGIPTSVISLICYCLCCTSSNDNASNKSKSSKKKDKNGQLIEQNDDGQQSAGEEEDEEYEERIVQAQPKFIKRIVKPADARDIPIWPIMPDESQKPILEKKRD